MKKMCGSFLLRHIESKKKKKKKREDTQKKGGTICEKKVKKKGPFEHHQQTPHRRSFLSRIVVCIYTYIDLLGRARADVVVTTVV